MDTDWRLSNDEDGDGRFETLILSGPSPFKPDEFAAFIRLPNGALRPATVKEMREMTTARQAGAAAAGAMETIRSLPEYQKQLDAVED